jgi:CheY-like chemotaxis protein
MTVSDHHAGPQAATRRLRILVVEDHDPVRLLTADCLRDLGHEVEAAATAEEALAAAARMPFDVLFTDHSLPGMSGVELAAAVLLRDPQTRIVLATGWGSTVPGLDRFARPPIVLTKPYMADDLAALAARLAAERGAT